MLLYSQGYKITIHLAVNLLQCIHVQMIVVIVGIEYHIDMRQVLGRDRTTGKSLYTDP